MKNLALQIVSVASFVLLAANAFGASTSIYDPVMTIYPEAPLSTDSVYAELSGMFPTAGYLYDESATVAVSGNQIDIAFFATSPTGIVAQVFTPFSATAEIGELSEGTYSAHASFYVDNVLEYNLRDSFEVSAVPIPAAVWLFASGLLGLIGMARRR